jgi:hypothetical protein
MILFEQEWRGREGRNGMKWKGREETWEDRPVE